MSELTSIMMTLAHLLLVTSIALPSLAACYVLMQVLLALLPATVPAPLAGRRPRSALLVPAHNESDGLLPTLEQAKAQMAPGDRLLVVADNCTDDTAAVARAAGAEVIERVDPLHRGKGHALDYGVRHLAGDPPEVVVVLDADCTLGPGCIARIVGLSQATGRPVQARYLMKAAGPSLKARMAEFAMRVKNWIRPRGMQRVGLPCGLYGTGMAFPWAVVVNAPLASSHLAEDMQLGLRLTRQGTPPLLCEEALVESVFAGSREGERSQRRRWEHGHLSLLVSEGPRLLGEAVLSGRAVLALHAVDLLVPPLALLMMLQLLMLGLAVTAWWSLGWTLPLVLALSGTVAIAAAIVLARARFAADLLSAVELLQAPIHVLGKLTLYAGFVVQRQVDWVRTRRDSK